jgi:histidine triad (HIT) family protein
MIRMNQDSIFTKIIKGEIPCHKIYEDEHTLAFLDIHPVQPGHVLVIPKKQIEFVWDLPDEDYRSLMATVKILAVHMRKMLPAAFVSARIVGVDVPHAHVHLIPFDTSAQLRQRADDSLEPDHSALAAIAEKLAL